MKRLIAMILLLALCISLAACSKPQDLVKHSMLEGISLGMTAGEVKEKLGQTSDFLELKYYGTYNGKDPGFVAKPSDNPAPEGAFTIGMKYNKSDADKSTVKSIEYMAVTLSSAQASKLAAACEEYYTSLYGKPTSTGRETVWNLGGKTTVKITNGIALIIGIYTE